MQSKGIALVQVLVIVACLSIIALFMSQSARQKVETAHWAMDKAQATVLAHSAENEVLFKLLSHSWDKPIAMESESDSPMLNFHGERTKLKSGIEITIQDLSSLINVNYTQLDILDMILENIGVSPADNTSIKAQWLDWRDKDHRSRLGGSEGQFRNGSVLDRSDLVYATGFTEEQLTLLSPYLTRFSLSHFNPYNAPEGLLELIFGSLKAKQFIDIREQNRLPRYRLGNILGTNKLDGVEYISGQIMRVHIKSHYNKATVNRGLIVELVQYEERRGAKPYNIYERNTYW